MYIILVNAGGGSVPQSWNPPCVMQLRELAKRHHILPDAIKRYFKYLLYQSYAKLANGGGGGISQS